MLSFGIITIGVISIAGFMFWRYSQTSANHGAEVLFETRLPEPYLLPISTSHQNGFLHLTAPVVHARLLNDIFVLDVKSQASGELQGFELAITDFDVEWIRSQQYRSLDVVGHVLVGPQGKMTNDLLRDVAEKHELDLPLDAGNQVQVFEILSVICDPAEFSIHVEAVLPSGDNFNISYDYAKATIDGKVPAHAFATHLNFQALGVRLQAA